MLVCRNSERSTCYKTLQRNQWENRWKSTPRHDTKFSEHVPTRVQRERSTQDKQRMQTGRHDFENSVRSTHYKKSHKINGEKLKKHFFQGGYRKEFWLFPQTTWESGTPNLLPWNKPSSKRNGRELAMDGPKYTWKKLKKSIKKLKHKHKAHTTFYWGGEGLRKVRGKDSEYCASVKNQKS
jgi:hypothetical protein